MDPKQAKRKRTSGDSDLQEDSSCSGANVQPQLSKNEKNDDCSCPICFEIIEDAQVTECGHTFCSKCISQAMEASSRCPTCNHNIERVFPNFMLNGIITKRRRSIQIKKINPIAGSSNALANWQQLFADKADSLNPVDIEILLATLNEKKKEYEKASKTMQNELLRAFLGQASKHKQDQLNVMKTELQIIEQDLETLDKVIDTPRNAIHSLLKDESDLGEPTVNSVRIVASCSHPKVTDESNAANSRLVPEEVTISYEKITDSVPPTPGLATRWRKMRHHFEDLEQCYINSRTKSVFGNASNSDEGSQSNDGLDEFRETLNRITSCNNLKTLSTLCYTNDPINEPSIVSSIEFDKDNEIFATAGVTKIIKLFDYSSVIKDSLTINYPIAVMECKSKISCVSWSSYYKSSMATSDYEGAVTVWDVFTKQAVNCFQEHERRCWSVDFNKIDTHLVTSGSDDGTVKLWSLNMDSSIATLKASANVCCVRFNPRSRYHVAFASADHCAYYYDLRNPKIPEAVFKGHRKAVSYVKFLNWDEIISASTDSQLKMWNSNANQCLRTFRGHVNEKNFAGLATDGDYITCGSENNSLFLYYKGFSKPILIYSFDCDKVVHPFQLKERNKKDGLVCDFVSAICWKTGENIIIAANSQGIIKILELV